MIGRPLTREQIAAFDHIGPELAAAVRLVRVPFLVPGFAGVTFGRYVLIRKGRHEDTELLAHELVHVRQYREFGFFGFLWRYLRQYVAQRRTHLRHRAAYKNMPFEIEARDLAKQWHDKPS